MLEYFIKILKFSIHNLFNNLKKKKKSLLKWQCHMCESSFAGWFCEKDQRNISPSKRIFFPIRGHIKKKEINIYKTRDEGRAVHREDIRGFRGKDIEEVFVLLPGWQHWLRTCLAFLKSCYPCYPYISYQYMYTHYTLFSAHVQNTRSCVRAYGPT